MEQPLVSIVVPIYKVPEKLLRQCIDSCINQTLRNIEIILVDDGSPDNCGAICDEYAEKDVRLKVIHKKNGGLAAARNTGQDAARGLTLKFLDGDDYMEQNCCQVIYEYFKKNNVEVVLYDGYRTFPSRKIQVHCFEGKIQSKLFIGEECRKLQELVFDFKADIGSVCSYLFSLDYLRKYNIRHIENVAQGMEGFVFCIQAYEHLEKLYYSNDLLWHYVFNDESITQTASLRNNTLIVQCLEWMDEYIKHSRNSIDMHPMLLNRCLYAIVTAAISGCFNPNDSTSFKEKKQHFQTFMSHSLCIEALNSGPRKGIDLQRRIVLLLIKYHLYLLISILGWMRRKQLENK